MKIVDENQKYYLARGCSCLAYGARTQFCLAGAQSRCVTFFNRFMDKRRINISKANIG